MKRTVIDTLKYRYRKLDSINNISSRIMLKEIENNFCEDIIVYDKYNLENQPIINH